jgi:hypothetical protein
VRRSALRSSRFAIAIIRPLPPGHPARDSSEHLAESEVKKWENNPYFPFLAPDSADLSHRGIPAKPLTPNLIFSAACNNTPTKSRLQPQRGHSTLTPGSCLLTPVSCLLAPVSWFLAPDSPPGASQQPKRRIVPEVPLCDVQGTTALPETFFCPRRKPTGNLETPLKFLADFLVQISNRA